MLRLPYKTLKRSGTVVRLPRCSITRRAELERLLAHLPAGLAELQVLTGEGSCSVPVPVSSLPSIITIPRPMCCPVAHGHWGPACAPAIPERSAPQDGSSASIRCQSRPRSRRAIATWSSRRYPQTARTANEAWGIAGAACRSPRARWLGTHRWIVRRWSA